MSNTKPRFTDFLENASAALPGAFTASVLGNVPNEVDDEQEHDPEKELLMKLGDVSEPDESEEERQERVFSKLKDILTGDDDEHHDENSQEDSHEGDTDHEEDEDEKHNQLLAAIDDLRKEVASLKTNSLGVGEEQEEEDEQEDTKQARARQMFTSLINQGMARQDIIDQFMKQIGVTNSTAVSYYQRLAKEAGLTTSGNREMPGNDPSGLGVAAPVDQQGLGAGDNPQDPNAAGVPQEEPESNIDGFEVEGDPDKQGLIRTVKGAHLVYKRKNEEGTFDELWVFGTEEDMKNALEVRRAILAGTDIPPRATKSENGSQSYTLTSLGNGQILHIKGLPN